ncbi:MAG: polysaccharide biosynthesis C-terminal domain-containing protein [Bacteroidota bacterium]
MSLIKKLAGETAIYGLSTIIGRVLNYLLVPLYTRIFLTAEYGIVAELYAYVGFLSVIFIYRMETAFFRYGTEKENRQKAYSTALTSLFGSTLFFVAALLLLSQPIANALEYPDQQKYIIWFAFIIGFDALAALPFARLRLENKALRFAVIKLINIGLNIGINLFFLLLCPWLVTKGYEGIYKIYNPELGIGYIFIANLVASAVTILLLSPYYFSERQNSKGITRRVPVFLNGLFDRALWKKMLFYAGPLVIVGFAGIINEMLDRGLLKQLLDGDLDFRTGQIGIYSANYKIAMLITLFTTAFTYAAEPFFFSNAKREDAQKIYATVAQLFTAIACLGFVGILLYIDIFKYFVGEEFRSGLSVVPILLLANICLGLYYNLAVWFKLTDRTIMGAYISGGGAIITIILNIILIPKIGYIGSAWTTLFCYSTMVIASYFLGQKFYPVPYKTGRILLYILLAMFVYGISIPVRTYFGPGSIMVFVSATVLLLTYLSILCALEKEHVMAFVRNRN